MKNAYVKKFAAAALVVAMAVTAVPAVSQIVSPTVAAQAAKKKKKTKKVKKTKDAKVTFLGAAFDKDSGVYVGDQELCGSDLVEFSNYKTSGKYTFTTNSPDLTITPIKMDSKEIKTLKYDFGDEWSTYLHYNVRSKKTGEYKVTIKETYKGKTRTLKKNATLYVTEPKADSEYTAYVTSEIYPGWLLNDSGAGKFNWNIVEGENTVLSEGYSEFEKDTKVLNVLAEGQAKVKITDLYGNDCGTVTVTAKTNHCTKIKINYCNFFDDDDGHRSSALNIYGTNNSSNEVNALRLCENFYTYGEENGPIVTDPMTYTSSNSDVARVVYMKESDSVTADWYLLPQSTGDTVITATCGSQSVQLPVHVEMYD